MDDWSVCMIDTRIVYGFPGAGKTSYISDCIRNDYFYRYGKTLVLCFEQGKEIYDRESLPGRNARVAYYDGVEIRHLEGTTGQPDDSKTERYDSEIAQDDAGDGILRFDGGGIGRFCIEQIESFQPARIYVEMNTKIPEAQEQFPEIMHVTSAVTLFDWESLEKDFASSRQMISRMVSASQQVTFRGCPSKELLAPYSQAFQLMNHRASYLRQDPMGFHEKAFDLFLPYSLDAEKITITAREYLVFWLDVAEHPEHYEGKQLCFSDPLELRPGADGKYLTAGRVVMTCCMSDLQFMSCELAEADPELPKGGWITLEARGKTSQDEYGRRVLKLIPETAAQAAAPKRSPILQAIPGAERPSPELPEAMVQRMMAGRRE